MNSKTRQYLLWAGGGIVTAVALTAFFIYAGQPESYDVNKVCTNDMAVTFHIHPHLTIIINGQQQTIPQGIGVLPTCFRPLHTHDALGTIHVESPIKRDFTLSDFFRVWGQPFDKNHILGYTVDDAHTMSMTVEGQVNNDWGNLVFQDQQKIVINYEPKTPQATSSAK